MNLLVPEVTIEECSEVIQAICKVQRFGPVCRGYNNLKELAIEIGQLQYMLAKLTNEWDLDCKLMVEAYEDKGPSLIEYAKHSVPNRNPAGA